MGGGNSSKTLKPGDPGYELQQGLVNGPIGFGSGAPPPPTPDYQGAVDQMNANPIDWGGMPKLDYGTGARDQAINASYGQATSRLDPMWRQREEASRTQLLNQGLDPSSEAYGNQMGELGRQRNDAYSSAMNSAIGQGAQAGQAVFDQSARARNQMISEALRKRGMPLDELERLQRLYGGDQKIRADGTFGFDDILGPLFEIGDKFIPG